MQLKFELILIYNKKKKNNGQLKKFLFLVTRHLEYRAGMSDTNLKGNHQRTIQANLCLICFVVSEGKT